MRWVFRWAGLLLAFAIALPFFMLGCTANIAWLGLVAGWRHAQIALERATETSRVWTVTAPEPGQQEGR